MYDCRWGDDFPAGAVAQWYLGTVVPLMRADQAYLVFLHWQFLGCLLWWIFLLLVLRKSE